MDIIVSNIVKALVYTLQSMNTMTNIDVFALFVVLFAIFVFLLGRYYFKAKRQVYFINGKKAQTVGFFHPYANSCGGGEKVLWAAVQSLQEIAEFQPIHCVIYTGDKESKEDILKKTKDYLHFDIKDTFSLEIVHLRTRKWLEAENYPHFTMVFQSIASMLVVLDGLSQFVPDVFFDTTGLAFTYPVVKLLAGCRILSYTHYPTISTDMLKRVREKRVQYNNNAFITNSTTVSFVKLIYYRIFSIIYGLVGRCADLVIVNGTWTYNHIVTQWRQPDKTFIIYPPCDTIEHRLLGIGSPRRRSILSIGQFRPEKDHVKQLYILRKLIDLDEQFDDIQLILVGGCRNEEDEARVVELKRIARDLEMEDRVIFDVNAPYERVQQYLATCRVGIHTMWNEHFGICVVELMASGLVVVAHDSAGPKEDIVVPAFPSHGGEYHIEDSYGEIKSVGFLASSVGEYVNALEFIFQHDREMDIVATNARERSKIFSTQKFIVDVKEKLVEMLR